MEQKQGLNLEWWLIEEAYLFADGLFQSSQVCRSQIEHPTTLILNQTLSCSSTKKERKNLHSNRILTNCEKKV